MDLYSCTLDLPDARCDAADFFDEDDVDGLPSAAQLEASGADGAAGATRRITLSVSTCSSSSPPSSPSSERDYYGGAVDAEAEAEAEQQAQGPASSPHLPGHTGQAPPDGRAPKQGDTAPEASAAKRPASSTQQQNCAEPIDNGGVRFLAVLQQRVQALVADARAMLARFDAFSAANSHVGGLRKLRTRFSKEVDLAVAADALLATCSDDAPGVAASSSSSASPGSEPPVAASAAEGPSTLSAACVPASSGVPPSASAAAAAAAASATAMHRKRALLLLKDTCLDLLDLTMHLLEREAGVVSVLHPVNPSVMAQGICRPLPSELPSSPFDVDIVSCGGLRWIKVKGTSPRNMLQELAGFAEKRSFLTIVANTVKAARCTLLPFGTAPSVAVAFYHPPPWEMLAALAEIAGVDSMLVYTAMGKEAAVVAGASGSVHRRRFRDVSLAEHQRAFPPLQLPIEFINFDVTALVALTSDTCNGHAGFRLPGFRILDQQSVEELDDPAVAGHLGPALRQHARVFPSLAAMCARLRAVAGNAPLRLFAVPPPPTGSGDADDAAILLQNPVEITESMLTLQAPPTAEQAAPAATARDRNGAPPRYHDACAAPTVLEIAPLPPTSSPHPQHRNWIVSDVAFGEFLWIMTTIAGHTEKRRAAQLLAQIIVVSSRDAIGQVASPPSSSAPSLLPASSFATRRSSIFRYLDDTGRIALRHRVVFGVGDVLHAVTLSANKAFVQAARDQGVECCVAFHPSRALTERKRLGTDRTDGPRKPPETPILQL